MADNSETDLSGLESAFGAAGAALNAFARGPARQASDEMAAAFARAGDRIARSLDKASLSGEASFKRLAKTVLEELAKIALERWFNTSGAQKQESGAGDRLSSLIGAAGYGGGLGGSSSGVNVNFYLGSGADAASISRSQGQIAAQVARAVAYGQRNL